MGNKKPFLLKQSKLALEMAGGRVNTTFHLMYRFVHPKLRAGYGEELVRTGCGVLVLSFSNHLASNLSARRDSQGIARIDNGRRLNNLRDNIFAITQMLEIADLLCFYKTNNLHIFRTETFYHLNPRLSLTSRSASKQKLKYPYSQGALNLFF